MSLIQAFNDNGTNLDSLRQSLHNFLYSKNCFLYLGNTSITLSAILYNTFNQRGIPLNLDMSRNCLPSSLRNCLYSLA